MGPVPTIGFMCHLGPSHHFGLGGGGAKIWVAPNVPLIAWHFFLLENQVYLVKIAFASETLENFSPSAGNFFLTLVKFCQLL